MSLLDKSTVLPHQILQVSFGEFHGPSTSGLRSTVSLFFSVIDVAKVDGDIRALVCVVVPRGNPRVPTVSSRFLVP